MSNLVAVLTGDLIGSTEAGPDRTERSMQLLRAATEGLDLPPKTRIRFDRHRGDAWQVFLAEPDYSVWVAVYLAAVLRADSQGALPSRIAIGVGAIDRLGITGLADAHGEAFQASGHALDRMAQSNQTLVLAGDEIDRIQNSLIAFIDNRISSWSPEQAEAVRFKLHPRQFVTQEQVAKDLGISRQAVGARLQASGYYLIAGACSAFRDHFREGYAHHA